MPEETNPGPDASAKVPESVLNQLHESNKKFHRARQHLEEETTSDEFDHDRRVNEATDEVRAVEKEVEQISDQIGQTIPPPVSPK